MADGSIKISIEVDGKQVDVAAKQLDNLEASGNKSGKGIKAAESSLDSLSDKSAKAGSSVKGAGDSIEGLGESGAKAGQGLKGAEGAIDGVADSSAQAASTVKGAGDTIEGLGSSGDSAAKGLQGVDGAIDGVADSSAQASDSVRGMSDTMADVDGKTNQASGSIKTFAASIGLVAIAAKAFDAMRASVDQAISRFDTLNAFPKVLQALGVSAEDSEAAMTKLSDGIDGLPTKLNDIAATAQRMYTSFDDMDKATDTALALNNALLGSGASADQAKRGTDQYIKALQTGEITMDTWNTLSETMDVGLVKLAEGFGYTGRSAKDDLYNALKDGTITLDEFNDKLIEVGTGTGIMAQLAKENSLGIATSFGNLRNAIANGVAKIIEAFNNLSIAVTGKDIAQNIDSMKVVVNAAFDAMKKAIEATTPVFKVFGEAIKIAIAVLKPFTPAILGLVGAFAALMVINKVIGIINASNAALAAARLSSEALTLATKKQMVAQVGSTAATKADTIAKAANMGLVKASTLAIGVLTGKIKLAQAAQIAWAAVTRGLNTVLGVMSGPIGIATLAIGGLVGVTIGIVKWFKKSSDESERLKEEIEQMGKETDELTQSVDSNSQAYSDQVSNINANKDANNQLLQTVTNLSQKENKSKEDKQKLKAAVEQLNGSVEGLNLMYNEEADRLNESSDKIKARIKLMSDLESGQAAQERYSEILQDQAKLEEQLNDVLKEKENNMKNGKIATAKQYEAVEDLTEQEEELRAKLEELGEEQEATEEIMVTSQENIKQAVQDGNAAMLLSYEDLTEAQQDAFDKIEDTYNNLKDTASDAFNTIAEEQEITMDELKENWDKNTETMNEWADNLIDLAERGIDQGLLEYLRNMGPEGAGLVADFVEASDDELKEMEKSFKNNTEAAYNGTLATMGEGNEEVLDLVISLVENTDMTMEEAIAAAGFEELGLQVPGDFADGISDGEDGVISASAGIIDATGNEVNASISTADFEGKGKRVPTDVASGIKSGEHEAVSASGDMANKVSNEASNNLEGSKFEGMGRDIVLGIAAGITSNQDSAISAASGMAAAVGGAAAKELEIHSPSRLFFRFGEFLGAGMEGGILSKQGNVLRAIANMTTAMINRMRADMMSMDKATQLGVANMGGSLNRLPGLAQTAMSAFSSRLSSGASRSQAVMARLSINLVSPFRNIRGQMVSVGSNAMAGLNAGLNGGAGRVMSTARNIASRVASTMRSALKIHSPSRVMEDDVGRWVPAGIAVGIEDNAKLVYRALDDLAAGMIKPVSPEIALGTSAMAYNGSDSMAQAVKNIRIPENKPDGSVAGLLREQNGILNRLLNKDTDLYVDSEKLTKAVNEMNAINAALSKF